MLRAINLNKVMHLFASSRPASVHIGYILTRFKTLLRLKSICLGANERLIYPLIHLFTSLFICNCYYLIQLCLLIEILFNDL